MDDDTSPGGRQSRPLRIWDLSPGYLSRGSLLGEHRELHGLHSILVHGKKGYARHPETLRWVGCRSGLARRHAQLAAEMHLRGYVDRTPVAIRGATRWPAVFVTDPGDQVVLLKAKYAGREPGRIPLPRTAQEVWAQHKYSVMARDVAEYRVLGPRIARLRRGTAIAPLLRDLVAVLRQDPPPGRVVNTLEHMWGHVRHAATAAERGEARRSAASLLAGVQEIALRIAEPYLLASTALSDLAVFAADA